MPQKVQTIINKRIRGFILQVIRYGDPQLVGDEIVNDCLAESGVFLSSAQLESFLNYLRDRGYINMKKAGPKDMGRSNQRRFLLSLTPKGVDVLEGIEEDPGLTTEGRME